MLIDHNFINAYLEQNITVAGNVDVGDKTGFAFIGADRTDRPCPDPACLETGRFLIADNQSSGNAAAGFGVTLQVTYVGFDILNNLARDSGTGFFIVAGGQTDIGSSLSAANIGLRGNVALHNGLGFLATLLGPTQDNTAAGNSQAGFIVVPDSAAVFKDNSAIGNGGPGVIVNYSSDPFDTETDASNTGTTITSGVSSTTIYSVTTGTGPSSRCCRGLSGPGASIPSRALTVVC